MRSKPLILCYLAVLFIFLNYPVVAADRISGEWEGLKKMMGVDEFRAAGLDNLSAEELGRLDKWLLQFLAYDSETLVRADEKIRKLQKIPVKRRIQGHFSGWKGKTIFRLDNGEVWKQRLDSRYVVSLENPEVEIAKNLLGFYELKVLKTGRKVGVKRVK